MRSYVYDEAASRGLVVSTRRGTDDSGRDTLTIQARIPATAPAGVKATRAVSATSATATEVRMREIFMTPFL